MESPSFAVDLASFLEDVDREQKELLALAAETQTAWEQALRVSFTRLRVQSKAGFDFKSLEDSDTRDDSKWSVREDLGTLQPRAADVDPLPSLPTSPKPESMAPAVVDEVFLTMTGDFEKNAIHNAHGVGASKNVYNGASPNPSLPSLNLTGTVNFENQPAELEGRHWFRDKASSYIDYVAGVLVLLNTAVMLVELEFEGTVAGSKLGYPSNIEFKAIEPIFRTLDTFFVYIYLVELLVRLWLGWPYFHRYFSNWFDTLLVISGLVDIYIIVPLAHGQSGGLRNIAMLRLFRAAKSLRSMRMVRTFRLFHGLRLLVQACQSFLPSLGWSMVLLTVFMLMGALIMGNLLQDFIIEETISWEDRKWIWEHYGTAWRSLYTLYEVTFAGNWPTRARPVMEKVSPLFSLFFVAYVTIIVFAVIRVISAVFLKDTLDAAHSDAENMVAENLHKKAAYVKKLETFFTAIDEFGDGLITEERLTSILDNPKVAAYFATLDVDVHESAALFHLLDDGDGHVTLEEFIDGICRCKGPARAIDQVAMHSDIKQLDRKLNKLVRVLRESKLIDKGERTSEVAMNRAPDLMVFRMGSFEKFNQDTSFHRHTSP